ncbi:MAG: hypothetical protein WC178_00410 [Candidatus Paceibacterota bacterium]
MFKEDMSFEKEPIVPSSDKKQAKIIPDEKIVKERENWRDDTLSEERPYEKIVSEDDLDLFKKSISAKIRAKALVLGSEEIKDFFDNSGKDQDEVDSEKINKIESAYIKAVEDFVEIDLEGLEKLDLTYGELDNIQYILEENLDDIWKYDSNKNECVPFPPQYFDKIAEVAKCRIVPLGMLVLYLSSFGPAFLKDLAGSKAEIRLGTEKITLKALSENISLMEKIDRAHNSGTPLDISIALNQIKKFEANSQEDGVDVDFSFDIKEEIKEDGRVAKTIYMDSYAGNTEDFKKLGRDLETIGVSLGSGSNGCLFESFEENEDRIVDIFSKDLNIPRDKLAEYIKDFLHPQGYDNVKVVDHDEFKSDMKSDAFKERQELQNKYREIMERHNISIGCTIEDMDKAEQEFLNWGRANGYANAYEAMSKEREAFENSPVKKLEELQQKEYESLDRHQGDPELIYENDEQFKEDLLRILKEEGYSIDELKKMGADNPDEVLKVLAETLGERFHYDWVEAATVLYNNFVISLLGNDALVIHHYLDKHAEGIPYQTLESEYGVCHDFAITMVAAKEALEEEGVPVNRVFFGCTTSDMKLHRWNVAAMVGPDGEVKITYLDITWMNSFLKHFKAIDAVGEDGEGHYYNANVDKATNEQNEQKEKAVLWLQEQLKQFLTQEKIMEELKKEAIWKTEAKKVEGGNIITKLRDKIRKSVN